MVMASKLIGSAGLTKSFIGLQITPSTISTLATSAMAPSKLVVSVSITRNILYLHMRVINRVEFCELARQLIPFLWCHAAAQTKQGDQQYCVVIAHDTFQFPVMGLRSGCMRKNLFAHSLSLQDLTARTKHHEEITRGMQSSGVRSALHPAQRSASRCSVASCINRVSSILANLPSTSIYSITDSLPPPLC